MASDAGGKERGEKRKKDKSTEPERGEKGKGGSRLFVFF